MSEYDSDSDSDEYYSDVEYERECAEKEEPDLIDLFGEVIIDGVKYDADGDVIMV